MSITPTTWALVGEVWKVAVDGSVPTGVSPSGLTATRSLVLDPGREATFAVTGTAPCPTPESLIFWGLPLALSVIIKVPDLFPVAVGRKAIEIVQMPLGARTPTQLSASMKSPAAATL